MNEIVKFNKTIT